MQGRKSMSLSECLSQISLTQSQVRSLDQKSELNVCQGRVLFDFGMYITSFSAVNFLTVEIDFFLFSASLVFLFLEFIQFGDQSSVPGLRRDFSRISLCALGSRQASGYKRFFLAFPVLAFTALAFTVLRADFGVKSSYPEIGSIELLSSSEDSWN